MYKIDRRGGVQKSYTRTDPKVVDEKLNLPLAILCRASDQLQ